MAIPNYPTRNLRSEHVTFDKLLVSVDAAVSEAVLHDLALQHRDMPLRMSTVDTGLSYTAPHMLFTMRAWLLKSQHIDERITTTVSVPVTAWDHIKHDMLQSDKPWVVWLAKLFIAPNYTIITKEEIHETRVCPHNNTYFPDSKQHIDYLLWRDDGDRLA